LSDDKQKQVIALGQLGWTLRRIEKQTGVRRETAAGYLRSAGVPVRPPGRWGRLPPPDSKLAKEVTTDFGAELNADAPAKPANRAEVTTDPGPPRPSRSPSASACLPYHELIEAALAKGRNAMAIWQDLVDQSAFTGACESVKRYARKLRGARTPEPCVVIETTPGEEAQVDYGEGPMVRDANTGKYRRMRIVRDDAGPQPEVGSPAGVPLQHAAWAELHEKAFRRLGGATRVVVPDYVAGHKIRLLLPAALCGLSFVVDTAPKLARTGKRDLCGVIRVFLRYCHRQ